MSGLLSIVTPAFAAFPKALGRGRIAYVTLYGALQQNNDAGPAARDPTQRKMHVWQYLTAQFLRNINRR
jgi:hypothetical protein